MKCKKCGKDYYSDSGVCPNCGTEYVESTVSEEVIARISEQVEQSLGEKLRRANRKTVALFSALLIICTAAVGISSFSAGRIMSANSSVHTTEPKVTVVFEEFEPTTIHTDIQTTAPTEFETTPVKSEAHGGHESTETESTRGETPTNASADFTSDSQEYVYVTASGKKYHKADCKYLRSSSSRLTRSEAEEQGYTPCSVCNP